jgi:hypothetical protein
MFATLGTEAPDVLINHPPKPGVAGSNPAGGAASDQPKRRLTWKNQQRSIFALMLLCAAVSIRG